MGRDLWVKIRSPAYQGKAPLGWLDRNELEENDGVFFMYTNMGMAEFKVVLYDAESERYLVECIKHANLYFPPPEDLLELAAAGLIDLD